jgi:hypothetical protein
MAAFLAHQLGGVDPKSIDDAQRPTPCRASETHSERLAHA